MIIYLENSTRLQTFEVTGIVILQQESVVPWLNLKSLFDN
jgi:hypothetical protein